MSGAPVGRAVLILIGTLAIGACGAHPDHSGTLDHLDAADGVVDRSRASSVTLQVEGMT